MSIDAVRRAAAARLPLIAACAAALACILGGLATVVAGIVVANLHRRTKRSATP